jgi:hypothetical protein
MSGLLRPSTPFVIVPESARPSRSSVLGPMLFLYGPCSLSVIVALACIPLLVSTFSQIAKPNTSAISPGSSDSSA